SYWDNGNLMQEQEWKKGKLITIGDISDPQGKSLVKGTLKNGNGTSKSYHPNGKLEADGIYKDGLATGEWKYYNEKGIISGQGSMVDGVRTGLWKFYDENGKLEAEGNYEDDEIIGDWFFYEGGKLKEIKNFDEGDE